MDTKTCDWSVGGSNVSSQVNRTDVIHTNMHASNFVNMNTGQEQVAIEDLRALFNQHIIKNNNQVAGADKMSVNFMSGSIFFLRTAVL